MKHGIAMLPPVPETYAHWCRLSEEAGFDVIWVPDSQSLYRELYVSCAICAANTTRVLLGPNVTNPLTRHPATAASAIATVDEFSGGRGAVRHRHRRQRRPELRITTRPRGRHARLCARGARDAGGGHGNLPGKTLCA